MTRGNASSCSDYRSLAGWSFGNRLWDRFYGGSSPPTPTERLWLLTVPHAPLKGCSCPEPLFFCRPCILNTVRWADMKILRSGALWSLLTFSILVYATSYMDSVGHHKCSFVAFLAYLIAYFPGMRVGVLQGQKSEKNRAMALCRQSFDSGMSGSVRRVLNGIAEDRTKLLSEDEFFGPGPKVPSVHAPDDPQERPSPDPEMSWGKK